MFDFSKKLRVFFALFLLPSLSMPLVQAQAIKPMPTGEMLLNLKKLNVLGSALYIAAHPDDENTIMLSWLAKERKVRTSYLSLTRGDGGQNLIGAEQAELLGLIRTQELLAARAIDGPEQYFTRANDFGFSKNTEETLEVWGKSKVLADVVWRIRSLRPDVIICRFPPDARAGHGNHSASAAVAEEAFIAAADPKQFPEQLQWVKPWQAKRLVWNTFNFGTVAQTQKPAEKDFIQVDIGAYNPLLGKSYNEIAAESRSQHKSQGFGVPRGRGSRPEFLVHKLGEKAVQDVFDGIDITWNRVAGGAAVQGFIQEAIAQFKPETPETIVPLLVKAYQKLQAIEDTYWKAQKSKELENLILACAGLYFEINPNEYAAAAGENIAFTTTYIKRSSLPVTLQKIQLTGFQKDTLIQQNLDDNVLNRLTFNGVIPANQPLTQPYWLAEKKTSKGLYTVNDPLLIGLPEKPSDLQALFTFVIAGQAFTWHSPVLYKYTDEVRGELYRNFEIRPVITANIADKVYVFADKQPKTVEITLKAHKADVKGKAQLAVPKGWRVEPATIDFSLATKYQEQKISFTIYPSTQTQSNSEGTIKALLTTNQGNSERGIITVSYDHIPPQTLFPVAEAKVVQLSIQKKGTHIGYIVGAGDEVPAALRQIGYQVSFLGEKELDGDLSQFDAIVVGVRAYNTEPRLKFYQKKLMDYVKNGGNMLVQYQVNNNLQKIEGGMGPYDFKLSRDRVTVEEAEVRFLKPNHAILNTPNKITAQDFEGWIQERGLYFANEWDTSYETILSCNDPNEKPLDGGLLHATYGKGHYVFTGYAFFRQLPAGVAGAYRLFANLISVGK